MPRKMLMSTVAVLATLFAGCTATDEEPAPAPTPASPSAETDHFHPPPAGVLSLPGEAPGTPSGGATAGAGPLTWRVPEGWVTEQPSSGMRLAQYRIPGPGGDGECIVFYFGPGQGGDPMANARRWAGQFEQPDGSSSLDVLKVSEVSGAQVPVRLVEVTGIYDGGMSMTAAPPEKRPMHMLLGGIAEGADAPWFFKFTGPETTVRAQHSNFVEMMRSVGGSD